MLSLDPDTLWAELALARRQIELSRQWEFFKDFVTVTTELDVNAVAGKVAMVVRAHTDELVDLSWAAQLEATDIGERLLNLGDGPLAWPWESNDIAAWRASAMGVRYELFQSMRDELVALVG